MNWDCLILKQKSLERDNNIKLLQELFNKFEKKNLCY